MIASFDGRRTFRRMRWILVAIALIAATLGTLAAVVQAAPPPVTFAAPHDVATGPEPRSVAVGDVNGDTFLDLTVVNSHAVLESVGMVIFGDGAGGFPTGTEFATGTEPWSVAVGDLDGDTFLDVAVANSGSNDVSVVLGDGTGGFGAKTDFVTGLSPVSVAVGDLDGDTFLDLAVANSGSNDVSVLLGDGAGGFGTSTEVAAGTGPASVAVGDLDGDTFLDLAVANSGSNDVSVLLGDGAGGFGTSTEVAAGTGPASVAVGDLDGDTFLDLAVANSGSNDVSVLLGDGAGGFGTSTEVAAGTGPASVAVGDLDGDTFLDLAVANSGSNDVSVLLGDGAGGFATSTEVAAGTGPASVAVGNLDGDLRLDLVTANTSGASVSVLLNTTGTATVPGAPTIGAASGGVGQATVSWTAPASDGGSAVTGYVVTPYVGAVAQTAIPFTSTATTQTVSGLTNGTTYTFTVAATNVLGTGAESEASNPVTPALSVPGAPTIGPTVAGDGQATVSWTAPVADGGSPVTGYVVTPYVGLSPRPSTTFSSTATTQVVTGLTNGTQYRFRVQAVNGIGTGGYSTVTNPVTPAPVGVTPPGAPTIGSAVAGDGQATVSWTAPAADGGSPITGYVVTPYVGYGPQPSTTFLSTATTQVVTGLTNGTEYRFKVRAINTAGPGAFSTATNAVIPVALTVPGAPTIIRNATAADQSAAVSWTAPASDGGSAIIGYVVTPYVGYSPLPSTTFSSSATTQTVTGLVNGTQYRFRVQAINAVGTSRYSTVTNPVTPSA